MKIMTAGGKGSGRRPTQVDRQQFENNWDAIFGKKESKKDSDDCKGCQNCNCQKKTTE